MKRSSSKHQKIKWDPPPEHEEVDDASTSSPPPEPCFSSADAAASSPSPPASRTRSVRTAVAKHQQKRPEASKAKHPKPPPAADPAASTRHLRSCQQTLSSTPIMPVRIEEKYCCYKYGCTWFNFMQLMSICTLWTTLVCHN